jgi:hypothetical protein
MCAPAIEVVINPALETRSILRAVFMFGNSFCDRTRSYSREVFISMRSIAARMLSHDADVM